MTLIVLYRIRSIFLYLIPLQTVEIKHKGYWYWYPLQPCVCLCPCVWCFQKERDGSVKSLPQPNVDSDIWVPDYLTPSWVCLPNNQPILAIIQPGETALEVLSTTCKVGHCRLLIITCSSDSLRQKCMLCNTMGLFMFIHQGRHTV